MFQHGGHGSYRAGAALCDPNHPSIDISIATGHQVLAYKYNWHDHLMRLMSESKGDLPRPEIYMKKDGTITPCYSGTLKPTPDAYDLSSDFEIVFHPKSRKYYVVKARMLREPNDTEYDRFFRDDFDNSKYRIAHSKIKAYGQTLSYIAGYKIHKTIAG